MCQIVKHVKKLATCKELCKNCANLRKCVKLCTFKVLTEQPA